MKKVLVHLLIFTLVFYGLGLPALRPVAAFSSARLDQVERMLYGETSTEPIINRLEQIEIDLKGEVGEGSLAGRMNAAFRLLYETDDDRPALQLVINALEWTINEEVKRGPVSERLDVIEEELLGETQSGHIVDRVSELAGIIFPEEGIRGRKVILPAGTLIRVRFDDTVDSGQVETGDTFFLTVTEEIMRDGRLVVPEGALGMGRIREAETAGFLGRDGRLVLALAYVEGFDGAQIPITIDETARERNESAKLALGASIAGLVLLGPVGLIAGFFIQGRDVTIERGTALYVEVEEDTEVYGISF